MCDMTHSYVRHDSFICVTWLTHMFDMTHSYVRHDSFMCATWPNHKCNVIEWFRYVAHMRTSQVRTHLWQWLADIAPNISCGRTYVTVTYVRPYTYVHIHEQAHTVQTQCLAAKAAGYSCARAYLHATFEKCSHVRTNVHVRTYTQCTGARGSMSCCHGYRHRVAGHAGIRKRTLFSRKRALYFREYVYDTSKL